MLKTLPGLIPKESPIAKKLLQTVTLVCSNNLKCKVTPLFQQDLGGGQQSQSIQGPRWALCTLPPESPGEGAPSAQPRQKEKRGQTQLSQTRPHTPSAETTDEHWGGSGPGWSFCSPKRPRSLFNKMVFNRFKDFIRSSPWTNSRQCFLAMIYLSVMPTASVLLCLVPQLPWGCSLSHSLFKNAFLCLSLCSPLSRDITPVSISASRPSAGLCPPWGFLLLACIWGSVSLPASAAPTPFSVSTSLSLRQSFCYLCSLFFLQSSSNLECLPQLVQNSLETSP